MSFKITRDKYPKLFKNNKLLKTNITQCLDIGYNLLYGDNQTPEEIKEQQKLNKTKEEILQKINIENQLTCSKLENLETLLSSLNLNDKVNNLEEIVNKLFGISNNSSKRGEVSEELIYDFLSEKFKDYCYDKKNHIAHSGDGELISPSNLKCLVEIKNYTNSVTSKEIEKFVYDMAYTGNTFGLFISLQSNIVTKKGIQFDVYVKEGIKRYCVFVSNTFDELSRVESAVYILENIFKFQKHFEADKGLLTIISNKINSNLGELNEIVEELSSMKQKYLDMETNIKKQLDNYYYLIRDTEIKVKNKVDYITNNTITDLQQLENTSTCKDQWDIVSEELSDKIKPLFHKLTEVFSKNGFVPNKNNKLIKIFKNEELEYQIKVMKDKLLLHNSIFTIEVNKKNVDDSIKYIEMIL
jgi:hypothetical protein